MAWTYVNAGAVALGASPTPALPAGLAQNDLMVMVGTSSATFGATPPTGYTEAARYTTASPFLAIYYKFAGASETAVAITNANTTTAAVVLAYRSLEAFDVISAVAANASSLTIATNTATTTKNNDLVLSIYGGGITASATRAWTAPTGPTNRVNQSRTTTNTGMLVSDINQATAGTTTSYTATTAQTAALAAYAVAFKAISAFTSTLTATTPTTSTIQRAFSFIESATALITNSTIIRRVGKLVTANQVLSATITQIRAFLRTLAATVVTVSTIIKRITKTLTATAVATVATLVPQKVFLKTVTASAVAITATLVPRVNKLLAATQVTLASFTRSIRLIIRASVITVATIDVLKFFLRTLSATTNIIATISAPKLYARTLAAIQTSSSTIGRSVGKLVSTVVNIIPTLLFRGWFAINEAQNAMWAAINDFVGSIWSDVDEDQDPNWKDINDV